MPISAGISAGGSLLSGVLGSKAAKSAAATQQANANKVAGMATTAAGTAATGVTDAATTGANNITAATAAGQGSVADSVTGANSTLQNYLDQQKALYQPYQQAGTNSLASLQQLTGPSGPLSQQFSFNPSDLSSDPGYQFTLSQGQQALQRSAAAQGGLFSTGTAKSLAGYTTGTANQYFNDAYNRAANTFNVNRQGTLSQISGLQNLAGLGSTAAGAASTAIGNNAALQSGNTVQGGEFGANLGLTGTEAASGTNLTGATTAGGFGLTGAQIAGTALTGGASATAAGQVGSTNSWLSALNGGTNSLSQYLALSKLFPGGFPGAGGGSGSGGYSNPGSYAGGGDSSGVGGG